MSKIDEYRYHEGFVDAKEAIVNEVYKIVDDWGSWDEAVETLKDYFEDMKREIDSL